MPQIIVVGAGWFGLIAAKTYLQVHPTHSLLILEAASDLGGTWSRSRVYRDMITHNAAGGLEISDCPLENGSPTPEGYIRGADVTTYLETLATKHSLHPLIRYDSPVSKITRDPSTREWILTTPTTSERCEKLIIATGLTSNPFTPTDIPITSPTIPLLHSASLAQHQDLLSSPSIAHVTIYGGSKSAFDAAYLCAAAGKRVSWIIRTTGQGVASMFTATSLGQTSALLAPKRIFNALSPCIYNHDTLLSRLLHGTTLGRAIVSLYWKALTAITNRKHGLHTSPNGKKLTPDLGPLGHFWSGSTPTGVISQTDFWNYIHPPNAPITVHRSEITSISESTITLSDATTLTPDAHIWATGWTRNASPLSHDPDLALYTGVPLPLPLIPEPIQSHWTALETSADTHVLSLFPLLRSPPPYPILPRTHSPYRHYRLIAPPSMASRGDTTLAFVGLVHTPATGMMAELQAVWATAYLSGRIDLREKREEMEREVAESVMWARRRYLNLGEKCANVTFEFLWYFDVLMRDLGVDGRRKGGWREWVGGYTPGDYRGVLEEVLGVWEREEGRGRGKEE